MTMQDEQAAVVDQAAEEVKKQPDFHRIFIKDKINPDGLDAHFMAISGIPHGSSLLIWLSSPGGSPQTALMFDEKLKARGINVTYISYLFNASAAANLPQLSDGIRLTYPHSVFTFHGPTFNITEREDRFEMARSYSKVATDITDERIMSAAGLTKKEFKKYSGDDIILYGYQLLDVGQHGLVDGLILKEYGPNLFLIKTREGNKMIDVAIHKRSDIKDLPIEG